MSLLTPPYDEPSLRYLKAKQERTFESASQLIPRPLRLLLTDPIRLPYFRDVVSWADLVLPNKYPNFPLGDRHSTLLAAAYNFEFNQLGNPAALVTAYLDDYENR